MSGAALADFAWPASDLVECLTVLASAAKLSHAVAETPVSQPRSDTASISEWIVKTAAHLGCEAWQLDSTWGELETELAALSPAVLRLSANQFLAIVHATKKHLVLLGRDGAKHRKSISEVATALRGQMDEPSRLQVEQLLADAGVQTGSRSRVAEHLLREQSDEHQFHDAWVLSASPGISFRKLLVHSGVPVQAALLVSAHVSQYLLWLASWTIMGRLSLSGRIDHGWLYAWALLLLTLIPFRLLTTWLQGQMAIGIGALLKRRLLYGALKLGLEEVKHQGIGDFLGQALESEAVETLALGGGIQGLLALIEIAVSSFILGWLSWVLLAWCVLTGLVVWTFWSRYRQWTDFRLTLTHDLVEVMLGHRTRLVQQPKSEWHTTEDQSHTHYFDISHSLDRCGQILIAFIPRGWLVAALACLVPSVVSHASSSSTVAVLLGGVLLAFSAFKRLTWSFSEIAAAGVAWSRIAPIFHAAARPESLGVLAEDDAIAPPSRQLLEAERLTFGYSPTGNPVLQECSLSIQRGDRVLLEGPSGGGKTTLSSLLCGMRKPESGLLLIDGLDQHTLGSEAWRKRIASAPQFHENHILTETLAFNLLMGRGWPLCASDFGDAVQVCRGLGLGPLLETMPSGLMQMVGEGGWQLSHGERSRIFIARALLQRAELIVLDESFAALDPENLRTALEFTLKQAETLLVIAHP